MKTKTITKAAAPSVLLIASLLVPQTAHCFYNPSTGRWLSRDPINEPGRAVVEGNTKLRTWLREEKNCYAFVYNDPIRLIDPDGRKVQICCRDVNVKRHSELNCLAKLCGFRHCWLKTDTKQAGMGPAGGGPLPASPCCGTKTAIIDESKETEATCYDVPNADENCVNNELQIGRPLGDWSARNNCNKFAGNILKKCGGQNVCLKWTTVCGPDFGCMNICTQWAYGDGP